MHYYQFNIADYRKDTQHLTPTEHYIYRELMDWYYLDESGLPLNDHKIFRKLRMSEEDIPDIVRVLEEFFTQTDNEWVHGRIDREIQAYQGKCEANRINGRKGGRPKKPKKTQSVKFVNPNESQINPNQEPLTINHKPKEKKGNGRFAPPSREDVSKYVTEKKYHVNPDKFMSHYESIGWKVGKLPMKDWKASVRGWEARDKASGSQPQEYDWRKNL